MTENLPAVRDPEPRAEIATIDTDSWVEVMRPILALADKIYDTDFVPRGLRGSAPATAAAMLYGREVGLPPMTSLNMTHVVEGKPGLSAEGMRALVLARGHSIEFTESTGGICTMRGRRRGGDHWTTVTWDIGMARAAGLTGKNNWKNYPRALLQARATTELCRMVFPDVIHGFRSIEELEDMAESDDAPAAGGTDGETGSSKVSRKRTTKKAAAAAPRQLAAADAPAGMPPLPGEPGYDAPTETAAGGESDTDGVSAVRGAEPSGEDSHDSSPAALDAPGSDAAADVPEASTEKAGPDPGAQAGEGGESAPDAAAVDAPEAGERGSGDDPSSPDAGPHTEDDAAESQPAASSSPPRPISRARQRMLMARFGEFGIGDDREERLLVCSTIVGREVESTNKLTTGEASTILDTLANVQTRDQLNRLLDTIDESRALKAAAEQGQDEPS